MTIPPSMCKTSKSQTNSCLTDINLLRQVINSNRSFNQKHHLKLTPFIGDLVLLREGSNKNKPREPYIMEQLDGEFLLIRKLNKTHRPRLYRTHPQELIKAPTTAFTPLLQQKNLIFTSLQYMKERNH